MNRAWKSCCLVLLCCGLVFVAPLALAEDEMQGEQLTVTIDYEGAWMTFADFQFRLFLPSDWSTVEGGDLYFMAVDDTRTQAMWMELFHSEGNSMDTILEDLSSLREFEDVYGVYYNGVPFVKYSVPENNMFGFATLAAEDTIVLFIKFTPGSDEGLQALAVQIMASLSQ